MEDRTKQPSVDSAGARRDAPSFSTVIDAVRHPWDANAILERVMMIWEENPSTDVLVIVHDGQAPLMDNRLRVTLARVRKQLGSGFKQFGFTSETMKWTELDGTQNEVLILGRVVHARHTMIEAFDSILGEKK